MSGKTIRLAALVGLLAVLAVVVWTQSRPAEQVGASPARQAAGAIDRGARAAAPAAGVPVVALASLAAPRPEPGPPGRDPFRTRPTAPALPVRIEPSRPLPGLTQAAGSGAVPEAPAAPPPIPLRLIGLVEVGAGGTKVAVLSDGRDVYYGRDGEVIDGRYRIVRIGNDTVEMTYVDGRGRQTLRLPGVP